MKMTENQYVAFYAARVFLSVVLVLLQVKFTIWQIDVGLGLIFSATTWKLVLNLWPAALMAAGLWIWGCMRIAAYLLRGKANTLWITCCVGVVIAILFIPLANLFLWFVTMVGFFISLIPFDIGLIKDSA